MSALLQLSVLFVALHLVGNKVDWSLEEVAKLPRGSSKGEPFDKLLEVVLEKQQENYIEPIKSQHTRQPISLNGLYDFCFDPDTNSAYLPDAVWANQPLDVSCKAGNLYRMPVPAAFNEILSNETAKNYMGWMWYQKVVRLSEDRGKPTTNWLVQFGSINYLAVIWGQIIGDSGEAKLGARLLGSHVGGHLPIVVNVSELLHEAEPRLGINLRLSIAVNNVLNENTVPSGRLLDMSDVVGHKLSKFQPDFDFFHFAGITGDVQLFRLPPHYIKRAHIIDTQQAQLFVFKYCLANIGLEGDERVEYLSVGGLDDSDHDELIRRPADQEGCATYEFDCSQRTFNRLCRAIAQLDEWPTHKGHWVRLRSFNYELVNETKQRLELDVYDMKLFKRSTYLNRLIVGKSSAQMQGFGMHHEQLFSGRSMSLPAIMKDLELLKGMGANVLRTSHYPYSPAYLEACDELGIMVIAECPAVGLKSFSELKLALHKESLREMMLRDHEHPAIVMWSVANEPESQKPEARAYFEQLLHYARHNLTEYTQKAARPLTAAIAQPHEADRIGHLLDIIMVNRYYGWYEFTGSLSAIGPALNRSLRGWARRYGKPLVLSEFGAEAVGGVHSGELFSEQFQRDLIEEHERLFDQLAAVENKSELNFLGAMVWNFADFSTHESLLRVGGNRKGVFKADRNPKMAAESVRRTFRRRAGLSDGVALNSRLEL